MATIIFHVLEEKQGCQCNCSNKLQFFNLTVSLPKFYIRCLLLTSAIAVTILLVYLVVLHLEVNQPPIISQFDTRNNLIII